MSAHVFTGPCVYACMHVPIGGQMLRWGVFLDCVLYYTVRQSLGEPGSCLSLILIAIWILKCPVHAWVQGLRAGDLSAC